MYYDELNRIKFNTTKNTHVIILKYHNLDFKIKKKSYNLKLFGKTMIDYVKTAAKEYETKIIPAKPGVDVITTILPHLTCADYTAVLYCDTPLLTSTVIREAIDFAVFKNLDVCKLPRGYVFKNKFLEENYATMQLKTSDGKTGKSTENAQENTTMHSMKQKEPMVQSFNFFEEQFTAAINFTQLEKVFKTMQQKINENYQLNGVNILDSASTYIEPGVTFGKNVTIYPNNKITKKSILKNNVTVFEHNIISQTVMEENSNTTFSVLVHCVVKKNVSVLPFSHFTNVTIN